MIDKFFEVEDANGNNKKYSVLFKFDEAENDEHYVVYTDYSVNNQGNVDVKARKYSQDEDGKIKLSYIEHQEVKDYVEKKLSEILGTDSII